MRFSMHYDINTDGEFTHPTLFATDEQGQFLFLIDEPTQAVIDAAKNGTLTADAVAQMQ